MKLGVLKERYKGEKRVALTPEVIKKLSSFEIFVERGAGKEAGFEDEEYEKAGAKVVEREEVFRNAEIILKVRGLSAEKENFLEEKEFYRGKILIGMLEPFNVKELLKEIEELELTAFALELVPRITRAQNVDVLSSMATVAGYKAVLIGANFLNKMFPMLMTAAGTVLPAKVFVIGAGVAGLQAIATAKRLGAVVQAYDIRPSTKEQVESLGAKFLSLGLETKEAEDRSGYAKEMGEEFYKKQRELMKKAVSESDLVISTASVPGKRAPVLITEDMIKDMKKGSVIVDLAAERGGNCELTVPGEVIEKYGVKIVGALNLPSEIPYDASLMFSRNLANFLKLLFKDGEINKEDEIIKETLLFEKGKLVNERIKKFLEEEM